MASHRFRTKPQLLPQASKPCVIGPLSASAASSPFLVPGVPTPATQTCPGLSSPAPHHRSAPFVLAVPYAWDAFRLDGHIPVSFSWLRSHHLNHCLQEAFLDHPTHTVASQPVFSTFPCFVVFTALSEMYSRSVCFLFPPAPVQAPREQGLLVTFWGRAMNRWTKMPS